MTRFVLDCSVTMAWCFEDESSARADRAMELLVDGAALVPAVWSLEVANVLLIAERRGRLSEAESTRFLELLDTLPIRSASETSLPFVKRVRYLAREHRLSAYDAAYLELAMREGVPLTTSDRALDKAASLAGVDLL